MLVRVPLTSCGSHGNCSQNSKSICSPVGERAAQTVVLTGVQGQRSVTHHLEVSVSDVTERPADVIVEKPAVGFERALFPGRQATQSL